MAGPDEAILAASKAADLLRTARVERSGSA